ncbi:MAG: hypothetical protein QOI76_1774, partial [Frankiales bacterium]|nr:hypothetical protein [Frankiales bacterium]
RPATGPGGAKPSVNVADLIGPTWYLTSWTTSHGLTVLPDTDRPPTLVFDSRTAAHSDDPTNTASWAVRLGKGTLTGVERTTTALPQDAQTRAVNAAVTEVLSGNATWQIVGPTLTIRKAPGQSLRYSTALPVKTRAATAAPSLAAAVGRTWTLTSVTSAGRTWVPKTAQPSTLHFWSGGEAQEDDGVNNIEWSWHQSGFTLIWTKIWSTGVGTSGPTREVDLAVAAILQGRTSWSLEGDNLVISAPHAGRLSFSSDPGNPVVGTAAVTLEAVHGCGPQTCGRGLVRGAVTIANARGIVVWRMPVTPVDGGNDLLQAGTYTVTAKIKDGVCTPNTVTVVLGRASHVTLSCKDGISSD